MDVGILDTNDRNVWKHARPRLVFAAAERLAQPDDGQQDSIEFAFARWLPEQ
jgi:hypothetical protein